MEEDSGLEPAAMEVVVGMDVADTDIAELCNKKLRVQGNAQIKQ
jgi:hypothetical protein